MITKLSTFNESNDKLADRMGRHLIPKVGVPKKKELPVGTRVGERQGLWNSTSRFGTIVEPFYWRDSTDGTYRQPDHDHVPILWDNGDKGFQSRLHLFVPPPQYEDFLKKKRDMGKEWDELPTSVKLGYVKSEYPALYAALEVPPEIDSHVSQVDPDNLDNLYNFL